MTVIGVEPGLRSVDAVLIAGPTASGKSALALKLARDYGGAVINADSMQVYRELRILSARPGASEEAQAPHYLYGFVSAFEPFSVGHWLEAAQSALTEVRAKGLLPIITGGTGLYFAALLNGLSPIPDIHASIRVEARQRLAEVGNERFHAELAARDPVMGARLNAGDSQRLLRAWEVIEATGQSLSEWQMLKGTPVLDGDLARYVLKPNRDWLVARIARRFAGMIEGGALEEVQAVKTLNPDLPAARALGVPQLIAHLDGRLSLEQAIEQATAQTRQYAKRQMTWFRHQMPDWTVIERSDVGEMAEIISQGLE
ncbi:MAG: tRNA (adenosine(37)-N6)-dimethylallyltransferase MiaA [Alphaproteobacteria bacterium]|nr:tRNA (adenosine(37)-N6)-dimethylallyltransferase MiaA [Alphaproteobacteria bacterium]